MVGGGMRRAGLTVLFVAAGVLAVTAALAYACTVQPTMALGDGSAAPGGTVGGTGEFFSKTGGPVQLHFNSLDSAVVWSGPADAVGRIAFRFDVPDVAPGDYTIVATQVSVTGQPVAGTPSRAPLTVVASQPPAGGPAPGAPQRPEPRRAPQPERSPAAPRPSPAPAPAPRGDRPVSLPDRAGAGGAELGGALRAREPAAPEPAVTDRGAARPREQGRGSARPGGQGASVPERSAGGDLWSGFASAKGPSLTAGEGPPAAAGGPGLAVGVGMLGIGLVGLLGGVLVAALRRRRAVEQRTRPQAPGH